MVSFGKYLLVQVLVILMGISRISAQSSSCSSIAVELEASVSPGLVTSPNYPSNYPASETCSWKMTAPAGHVIVLKFLDFYIGGKITTSNHGCSDWLSDRLDIYDGNDANGKLLGRYCSTIVPPKVFSSGTSLFLKFVSDDYTERRGFKLEYHATVPKPDPSICSPFNTFYQNNNIQVSGSSGYIQSPLYGDKYPSSMQCTWVITVPEGKEIKLTFLEFSVGQEGFACLNDYIEIRDGQYKDSTIIDSYCSSYKPSPVTSGGRHLWIHFNSNSDNFIDEENGKKTNGFKIRYEAEISSAVGTVIGLVIAVLVVFFLIMICVRLKRKRRARNADQMTQPVAQTTLTYNRPNPTAPPYPTVHYSPAPQSSYPAASSGYPPPTQENYQQVPPGNYPTATTGGNAYTTQPSVPIRDHPSSTLLNDPPPAYPEVVPDVPPPPYPGIPQNPSQVPTAQQPATSYISQI